jgi:hypothetical protein
MLVQAGKNNYPVKKPQKAYKVRIFTFYFLLFTFAFL